MTDPTTAASSATGTTDPVERLLAHARRWPLLSAAEEVELARRVERGDPRARERMVLSNTRLVVSVARRYAGYGVPLADLVQEGMVGLLRAVDGFDWRRGFRFSTYATIWIRKRVLHALDRDARPQRLSTSLDRPLGDDEATTVGELIAADEPSPEAVVATRWQRHALATAVAELPATERTVIALRFGAGERDRGPTFDEVGRAIGRSAERARQIEQRALRRLAANRELAPLQPTA